MRFITLVTYCIINSVLWVSSDAIAATTKAQKKSLLAHHGAKDRAKKNAKVKLGPTDVWERVRAGMQIARPAPVNIPPEYLALLPTITNPPPPATVPSTDIANKKLASGVTKPLNKKASATIKTMSANPVTAKPIEGDTEFDNTNSEMLEAKYSQANYSKARQTTDKEKISALSTCDQNKKEFVTSKTYSPHKRIHTQIDFKSGLQDHRTNITSETITDNRMDDFVDERIDSANNLAFPVKLSSPCKPKPKQELVASLDTKLLPENSMLDVGVETTIQPPSEQELRQLAQQAANYHRVNNFIQRYAQQTGYLKQVAERSRPYLFHIVESLKQYNLPMELALLPIVESSYVPTALSPKSAAGLWQFIPSTGAEYNLKQTEFYDERLDITTSTNAAMRYLSFLRQHFHGDWLLAIAAYNCGPGRVDAAVEQNKANGLNTDYWSLQLPDETEDYVPRLLALAAIFSNPTPYNLKLNQIKNEPYFLRIKIDREIDVKNLVNKDLRAVAELANLSLEQFTTLNPGFLNAKLSNEKSFSMLMPGANAQQLHQRLDMLAEIVTNNEKTTPNVVMEITNPPSSNKWQEAAPTLPYLSLNVNANPPADQPNNKAEPEATPTPANTGSFKIHHLEKGDTLASVAKLYQVSVADILAANQFSAKPTLAPGQRLKIPVKSLRNLLDLVKS